MEEILVYCIIQKYKYKILFQQHMNLNAPKAKCKKCGKEAAADMFKLHYVHKMMVCPDCFSGRTEQKKALEDKEKKTESPRPAGWDADDVYLEKAARSRKQETSSVFKPISGTEYVQCACQNCKYTFRYHPIKKMPWCCPYCNAPVPKLRTFGSV